MVLGDAQSRTKSKRILRIVAMRREANRVGTIRQGVNDRRIDSEFFLQQAAGLDGAGQNRAGKTAAYESFCPMDQVEYKSIRFKELMVNHFSRQAA